MQGKKLRNLFTHPPTLSSIHSSNGRAKDATQWAITLAPCLLGEEVRGKERELHRTHRASRPSSSCSGDNCQGHFHGHVKRGHKGQRRIASHCITSHCTASHCIASHRIASHRIASRPSSRWPAEVAAFCKHATHSLHARCTALGCGGSRRTPTSGRQGIRCYS